MKKQREDSSSYLFKEVPCPSQVKPPSLSSDQEKGSNSSSDSEDEYVSGSRVGTKYQAKIPRLQAVEERNMQDDEHKAELVWYPVRRFTKLQEQYISDALGKNGYSEEQALSLLFWHRHDPGQALADLGKFSPNPDENWTTEDEALFEAAYSIHGKVFNRIQTLLPHKSISTVMCYYYRWKTLRETNALNRRVKKLSKTNGNDQNTPPTNSYSNLMSYKQGRNKFSIMNRPALKQLQSEKKQEKDRL